MYNRFTEKAEKALKASHDYALQLGHDYVGTEHLLLGVLKNGTKIIDHALKNYDVTEDKVIAQIIDIVGRGSGSGVLRGFTPRTKKVLELSLRESKKLGCDYINTEHLLLGIIREGESVALKILINLGVDLQKVAAELSVPAKGESAKAAGTKASSNTPVLNQHGRDLTEMARDGKFDPVIGRDKEIERIVQILSRRTKNNPCIIGEPGVGKTALAEGLAQRIIEGNIPEMLKSKRVVTLDLSSMVAGAKYRGEFEDRLKKALEEIRKTGNVILFIDEMHTIIGAGAAEGAIDASNILKPLLARGEIQVIGATTLDEYKKHVEKDAALERRFQPITVGEPTEDEAIEILKGVRDKYEAHHRVKITDDALVAAVKLSSRYIADRFLPDKAIDLIDEAASKVRIEAFTTPSGIKELEDKMATLKKEKEEAVKNQEFEKAAVIRDEEQKVSSELDKKKEEWSQNNTIKTDVVSEGEVAEIVASWTGIPVKKLAEEETEKLMKMEDILHMRVIGQDEAIKAVSKAVRRGRVGLKDPKRPTGSFIFLGPTGVGKTELCKALAEALFGDEKAMIRLDMSEYMEKHTVSRLVGSPPGYVGYEEGGQLTEKVRRKPYSVVLFDEIEKAHPDVFNTLLQILEDGRLTDSQGRTVDFRNTVIIMTSNVGARMITEPKKLGFAVVGGDEKSRNHEDMKSNVMAELKKAFKPEFLNRVDEIIMFHLLDEENVKSIADIMIDTLAKRLKQNEINLEMSEAAKVFIAKKGYDQIYGARPLRRVIQNLVEDKLAELMLEGKVKAGKVLIDLKDDELIVSQK